jgi:hypothetical protein
MLLKAMWPAKYLHVFLPAGLACVAALLIATPYTNQLSASEPNDSNSVVSVADGYQHNRDRFRAFSCRFEVIAGQANSVADAEKGELQDTVTAQGLWLVHGDRIRFDLICDPAVVKAIFNRHNASSTSSSGRGVVAMPLPSEQYLADAKMQLLYAPSIGIANVFSLANPARGIEMTPWDVGIMGQNEKRNPGQRIREAVSAGRFWTFEETTDVAGKKLVRVRIGASAKELEAEYVFDRDRGFLAVEARIYTDNGKTVATQVVITDCKQYPGGCWFPMKAVSISWPDRKTSHTVALWRVKKLEPMPPRDQDFVIELALGTVFNDRNILGPPVVLQKAEKFGLADLPKLSERCRQAAEKYQASIKGKTASIQGTPPAAAPAPALALSPGANARTAIAWVALALILAVATFVLVKKLQGRFPSR